MEIGKLHDLARQHQVSVLPFPMAENGSASVMLENGACFIGMDDSVRDGGVQERVHLGHELGHCVTGSFYNRYATGDLRQKHENRADKWAIEALVPVSELDDAVARGYTELWELAEYFGVTEEFMKKAVCWYVHGNVAEELYF